jgi:hypothetical protein
MMDGLQKSDENTVLCRAFDKFSHDIRAPLNVLRIIEKELNPELAELLNVTASRIREVSQELLLAAQSSNRLE